MAFQPRAPRAWTRPVIADPAVVLGEALRSQLPPPRLSRLIRTLPGGAVILRRYPSTAHDPGAALQAIWQEGLASQFRARAAALSASLLEALDHAGWTIPADDPFGDTSEQLAPAVFSPHPRYTAQSIRSRLSEAGGPPVVLTGPSGGGASSVVALTVEDPRVRQTFPGGIFVSQEPGPDGLLDFLRDVGTRVAHAQLARAIDLERALAQFRDHFRQRRCLLVVDGVDDYRAVRRLWGGLGELHRVLLTSEQPLPPEIPAHRIQLEPFAGEQALAWMALWAGPVAQTSASRSLARILAEQPALLIRCARLVGGPEAWIDPAEVLGAIERVDRGGPSSEQEDAALSVGIQTAPPILAETMLALSVLPHAPAVLPDDLFCTVVGAERWEVVRNRLAASGLIECVGSGRWRIPSPVSRVIRRRSTHVPALTARARQAAIHWSRRRLEECAADWTIDRPPSLRLRELRADRRVIVGILGQDPLETIDPTIVPFGLIAWLLPCGKVRTLVARCSTLAGHPWRGDTWRWLADDLLHANRQTDAARLLSSVIETSRRTNDLSEYLDATVQLARVQLNRGRVVDGRALLEVAIRHAGAASDQLREGSACLALGDLLDITGDQTGAEQMLCRAVNRFRAMGRHSMAAEATGRLGMLARRAGMFQVAAERFRMQAALAEDAQDREGVTTAEYRLGRLALDAGQPAEAVHWLGRALKAWEDGTGTERYQGTLFAAFTEALMAIGRLEDALTTARRRIKEARRVHDRMDETAAVTELARILSNTGAHADALRLLTDALRRARAFSDRRGEAQHLLAAGTVHGARLQPKHAVVCFEAARHVAEDVGWRTGLARAFEGVAIAEASMGQVEAALRDARGALALYQRIGEPRSVARWQVLFGGMLTTAGSPTEGQQLMSTGAQALAQLGWSPDQITALVDGGHALCIRAGTRC